jgi:hypothetical protein
MASYATAQMILPEHVLNDLIRFIDGKYQKPLPNSLLIAQAFILKHQDHGKGCGFL